MSALLESIADDLAIEALAAQTKTDDDTLTEQISKAIGTSSPTFQEAFNTAVRIRRAEAMGRTALARILEKAGKADD
jgi:hypothetical protein